MSDSLNLKKADFDAKNVKSGVIEVAERESDDQNSITYGLNASTLNFADFDPNNVKRGVIEIAERESNIILAYRCNTASPIY